MTFDELVDKVKEEEGFKPKPYQDSKGIWTFGHGLTYITAEESEIIVRMRLHEIQATIWRDIKTLSSARQTVLVDMAYQLGVKGLYCFHKMWDAIRAGDFNRAADEIMDSHAARIETPERFKKHAEIMRRG